MHCVGLKMSRYMYNRNAPSLQLIVGKTPPHWGYASLHSVQRDVRGCFCVSTIPSRIITKVDTASTHRTGLCPETISKQIRELDIRWNEKYLLYRCPVYDVYISIGHICCNIFIQEPHSAWSLHCLENFSTFLDCIFALLFNFLSAMSA